MEGSTVPRRPLQSRTNRTRSGPGEIGRRTDSHSGGAAPGLGQVMGLVCEA
jgi:hypothetical protein